VRGALVALAVLALALPVAAGGAVDPCGGGGSDFVGEVLVGAFAPGTIGIRWSVWEDASTREYRVSRHPSTCSRPSCTTRVAKVRPTGGPAAFKSYSLTDTAPPGAWVYRLEIRRIHGPSCTFESNEVLVEVPPACDPAAVCAQAAASFNGEVLVGAAPAGIQLRWATHAETGAGGYRLSRFDCATPRDCTTEVATVDATGSCGQVILHSVTNAPPAGTWTYVLEVLDSGGRTACSLRLPAPASPASSR
jgi:hypothetical protein